MKLATPSPQRQRENVLTAAVGGAHIIGWADDREISGGRPVRRRVVSGTGMPSRDGSSPLSRLSHGGRLAWSGGRLARPVAGRWFRAADVQARKELLIDFGVRLTLFRPALPFAGCPVSFTALSRAELGMAPGRHRPVESGGDAARLLSNAPRLEEAAARMREAWQTSPTRCDYRTELPSPKGIGHLRQG
ncbi:hypothetical protein SGL43_05414 [Streptomyces globisporus]|uniref:Uncharacterized protein n=1 Tax=Streptomyces globisporus TaxID=1908 RepID=A0ABM9H415_STRGL|nr:hypothetical protein SGL43_05414 [Streptomyces globisporus]